VKRQSLSQPRQGLVKQKRLVRVAQKAMIAVKSGRRFILGINHHQMRGYIRGVRPSDGIRQQARSKLAPLESQVHSQPSEPDRWYFGMARQTAAPDLIKTAQVEMAGR